MTKPARWGTGEWADNSLLLEARAAGACEKCGKECGPVQRHHRKRRREGGDSLENLLFVGAGCHAEIHARPVVSRRYGWIVSSYVADPSTVPVLWHGREWVMFTPDGGKIPAFDVVDAHEAAPAQCGRGPQAGKWREPPQLTDIAPQKQSNVTSREEPP